MCSVESCQLQVPAQTITTLRLLRTHNITKQDTCSIQFQGTCKQNHCQWSGTWSCKHGYSYGSNQRFNPWKGHGVCVDSRVLLVFLGSLTTPNIPLFLYIHYVLEQVREVLRYHDNRVQQEALQSDLHQGHCGNNAPPIPTWMLDVLIEEVLKNTNSSPPIKNWFPLEGKDTSTSYLGWDPCGKTQIPTLWQDKDEPDIQEAARLGALTRSVSGPKLWKAVTVSPL